MDGVIRSPYLSTEVVLEHNFRRHCVIRADRESLGTMRGTVYRVECRSCPAGRYIDRDFDLFCYPMHARRPQNCTETSCFCARLRLLRLRMHDIRQDHPPEPLIRPNRSYSEPRTSHAHRRDMAREFIPDCAYDPLLMQDSVVKIEDDSEPPPKIHRCEVCSRR